MAERVTVRAVDDADQPEPEGIPAELEERIDAVRERAELLAAKVAEVSAQTRTTTDEPQPAPSAPRRFAAWLFERRPPRALRVDETDEIEPAGEPERRPRPAPMAVAFEAMAAAEGASATADPPRTPAPATPPVDQQAEPPL